MAKQVLLLSTAVMTLSLLLLVFLGGAEQLLIGVGLVLMGGFVVSIVLALRDTLMWAADRSLRR